MRSGKDREMCRETDGERMHLPVELTVNGRTVAARPGQTILELVREQGLDEIPTLCHEPGLPPFGSCFLCVVEVRDAHGILPSCTTRVRDGMEIITRSDRITRARKTALSLLLSDHYADCACPGQLACPAGVDVQGYLGLARLGHYREALRLIRERNPLPVVCGRVCVRRCEAACRRNLVDESVGINHVKRFVSGYATSVPPLLPPSGKRAAVVGGGPAGLTCTYYLSLQGHAVTIFEAMPRLGGMLRYGIPAYRLPREELDADIDAILSLGAEVVVNRRLGVEFTLRGLKEDGFDAIFLAPGAPLGKKLGVPGEDGPGVESALDFLRDTELHGPRRLHGRVAVVGGGNSAVDAARTAVRCGAEEVVVLYRRSRREMPAFHEEVDAAEQEGVRLETLVAPVSIVRDAGTDRLTEVRCVRMKLGEPDRSGRRRPLPVPGSEFAVPCSFLFSAIGQETDPDLLAREPEDSRPAVGPPGTIVTETGTMSCRSPGVFAGGDAVSGPSAVIDAVAQGRMAAEAIDGFLRSGEVKRPAPAFSCRRDDFGTVPETLYGDVERNPRRAAPRREAGERRNDFQEVEEGLPEEEMREEAARCMECGCKAIHTCDLRRYAAEYGVDVGTASGQVRRHKVDDSHPLISIDANKCILCGRCIRACEDVIDQPVLGFVGRGFDTTVKPAMGRPLAESACNACGACVESCPTGALTAKLPYGRQGPWQATRVPSACGFCSMACPLDLHVVTDGLLWAASRADAGGRRGDLCAKGRFGTGLLQTGDRIRDSWVRKDGVLRRTSRDKALREAGRLLADCRRRHGDGSIAVVVADRVTREESLLAGRLAREGLRTGCVGSLGTLRRGGPRRDLDDFLGRTASTCFLEEMDDADVVVVVGADPGATHPVLGMRLRRAARKGAFVVVVHSCETDLVRPSTLWLNPRRGTSGILLADVLQRILADGSVDRRWAGAGGSELEALRELLGNVAPDGVSEACGVDAGKAEALAKAVAGGRKVVAVYDLEETAERSTGDLAVLARILAVTGHLVSPAGGLLLLGGGGNTEAAVPAANGGRPDPADALSTGRIRGAVVLREDPLSDPEGETLLAGMETLIVADHCWTRTARAAQVVFPASTIAETDGTMIRFDGIPCPVKKACEPPGGRTTAETIHDLAEEIGCIMPSARSDAISADLFRSKGISPVCAERILASRALGIRTVRLSGKAGLPVRRSYATINEAVHGRLAGQEIRGAF
jgi:formate dehydrogenase major subunit